MIVILSPHRYSDEMIKLMNDFVPVLEPVFVISTCTFTNSPGATVRRYSMFAVGKSGMLIQSERELRTYAFFIHRFPAYHR